MVSIKEKKRASTTPGDVPIKRKKGNGECLSKNSTLEVICEKIKDELHSKNKDKRVFECYQFLCNNTEAQIYFKKNLDIFSSTLQNVLYLTIDSLKEQDEEFSKLCLQCVNTSLEFILDICRVSSVRDKLEEIFLADLIDLLCNVSNNIYLDINPRLNLCIRRLMFYKTNKLKFKDADQVENMLIFNTLKEKSRKLSSDETKFCFGKIMEIAKETHDTILMDFLFRNLVLCLTNIKTKSFGIDILVNCLKDVTFDFNHEIKGISLASFLDNLVQEILARKCITVSDYNILKAVAQMNAVILQNKNEALLMKIFINERPEGTDNEVSANLIKLLLEVSISLKRETKFVDWLLNSVKECTKQEDWRIPVNELLDATFLQSFSQLIFRIGLRHSYNVLKTLMYFLKSNVIDQIDDDSDNILIMLQVLTELFIAYFNGAAMQDHLRIETAGEKFIQTMIELREMFNELLSKSLEIKCKSTVTNCLVRIIHKWEFFTWMFIHHYDYHSTLDFSSLSINSQKMQKCMKRIMKPGEEICKNALYEYMLFRIFVKKDDIDSLNRTDLLQNISTTWPIILKKCVPLIEQLNYDQVMDLASHVLTSLVTNETSLETWVKDFKNGALEDNPRFTAALVCQIFLGIKEKVKCATVKDILSEVNVEHLFQYAVNDPENTLSELLLNLRTKIFESTWNQMREKDCHKLYKYLYILQHLKIEFFSLDFRRIIFMLLYSICQTCKSDKIILESCCLTFSDLLYGNEDKFAKCVHPLFFFNESFKPHLFHDLFIRLLKKKKFIQFTKSNILSDSFELHHASTLLRCIENATPRCSSVKAKPQLKKLYSTVCDVILERAKTPMTNPCEVKALTLSLKENATGESVNDNLKESTVITLRHLMDKHFNKPDIKVQNDNETELLNATQQLAIEALRKDICSDMKKDLLKFLYKSDTSMKIEVSSLFKIYTKADFVQYYDRLQAQLKTAYQALDEDLLKNYVLNWIDIIKADVGTNQDLRLTNLSNALVTLLSFKLDQKLWEPVLQLVHTTITTKLAINRTIVDACVMLMENCLRQCKVEHCLHTLQFCSDLFMHRTVFATDRSSIILDIFGSSVKYVIRQSRITGEKDKMKFTFLLNAMEKAVITFNKFKKDIGRSNIYMIGNIIKWYSEGFVPPFVKDSLQICIGTMLSSCDHYAIAFLRRCMPDAEQKIFDSFFETYKKHYKFTGKI